MSKTKLLFITNNFPPISCGVGDYTYHLAREFVKNGYEVHVVSKTNQQIEQHWQQAKTDIQVLPIGGSWQKDDWKNVLGHISQLKPTHLLFQYVPGAYNRYAVPWHLLYFFQQLKKLSVEVVTTFHETYVRFNWSHPKYLYLALGQRYIARRVVQQSHQLVTSIDRYERQLQRWSTNITLIPVGSNILPISVSEEELSALQKTIAPSGEAILSTFGNRDHQPLLELFAQLLEISPNSKLLIIGKLNADFGNLQKKVRNQVYVTGFLDAPQVYKHLKASDAFISVTDFTSKGGSNNKSGALAAAFAAGLPIIGSSGTMTNRLLLNNSQVQWISFHDTLETINTIIRVLKNKKEQNRLSKDSIKFFNNFLDWSQIQKQYRLILKKNDNT